MEWFKIEDYPYFKGLQDYARLRAKGHRLGADVEREIKDKGPILSCVMLLLAHDGGRGSVENMVAGVRDFVAMAKAAPDDVLESIDEMIVECTTGDDDPFFCQLVELERKKRRGEVKDWGAQFDGRQVSIWAE